MTSPEIALGVVNNISAMVAYWDADLKCRFSNDAYEQWFGRTRQEMTGISIKDLLGPLFEKNLPHIKAVLAGERQVFERQIRQAGGAVCDTIATYTPDKEDGVVRGFYSHVADVTLLKNREAFLERTLKQRDEALAEVHTLQGLLPICAGCKNIKDEQGNWQRVEHYVSSHLSVQFSHGLCPQCIPKYFPGLELPGSGHQ